MIETGEVNRDLPHPIASNTVAQILALCSLVLPPGQRNLLEFVDTTLLDEVEKEGFIQKLR